MSPWQKIAAFLGAERKSANVWERWVELMDSGAKSKAGPSVTRERAFQVAVVLACLRVIAGGAALPFRLYRETQDGLRRIQAARDHPVYDVAGAKPNAWQTSFEFREQLFLHAGLGNAYVAKGYYRGKVAEMILLDPARVTATQADDWTPVYKVRGRDGTEQTFGPDRIWHVRGPSWDGFLGLDMLKLMREALGLSIAIEESVASLHANGVRPTGTYSIEGNLSPQQHDQITAWLKKQAAAGAGAPMILDRGAKWLQQAMTSVDAQTREMRQHQIEDICRFFGVLPIMIGFTGDKANTYASAEAMFGAHRVHTLAPWLTRVQESADINLLTDEERKAGYYFKFVINALNWAALKDQGEYFAKALGSGGSPAWLSQDEVRGFLELDPMGGAAAKLPPLMNQTPAPAPAP